MTTSTDARCLHCDAALAARELSEGWCDSCGKRLPGVPRPASKPGVAAASQPSAGGSRAMLWGAIAFVSLFVAAAIAAASAG
jgi:hypothetical protein